MGGVMKEDKIIDFMGVRKIATAASILLVLISLGALLVRGLNFGLDFTGGTLVELHYSEAPVLEEVRDVLAENGYPGAVVVSFGGDTQLMVRLQTDMMEGDDTELANTGNVIAQILQDATDSEVDLKRSEMIGAQVGDELANNGALGVLLAMAVIFAYVAMRFQFKFSLAAVVALIHDVIITMGVFAVFQLDFDLTVLAAVLAIIGYSLNDSIVVSDRIRENFRIMRSDDILEIINVSLTQTLGRTLMTSGTTMVVVVALYVVGGELIHNFALALMVGIGVGTYSSIYVGSAILYCMNVSKADLMPPEKEGQDLEEVP